ncbi:site-specific integrase [Companilactobacillus suantsaicola]|uniref:Site-specific integrase n=2 Tax=Companilactobacillus suantsaicola TaxID=2487723 RepID=A0A4Z0JMA1_9LACO|nr:site-specific integrase [Companilactobacillus suantsaicola]
MKGNCQFMASIHKRNGKWEYRVSYKDPTTGKYRNRTKGGFVRKTECEEAARIIEMDKSNNVNLSKKEVLFSDYFKEWVDTYKIEGRSKSTVNRYYFTHKVIKENFPDERLIDVTKKEYQTFMNKFGKKRTLVTMQKYQSFIHQMVVEAIEEGIIHKDFTRSVELIAGRDSKKESDKFLEPDDYVNLIKISKAKSGYSNISATMIYLATETGMRYEEITALTWDKINFDDSTIRVDKAYRRDEIELQKTKTPSSVRTLTISDECLDVLKNYKLEQQLYFKSIGYIDKGNFVFRTKYRTLVQSKTVNDSLKDLLTLIGAKKMVSFHDIRHTHISYLMDSGMNPKFVSQHAGHKELKTTLKYYTHLFNKTALEQNNELKDIFDNITKER